MSNTVLTMPLAVLTNQDYFDEDAANTVAIEKGNQLLQWHIYDNYPQWRFVEYASADEAEKAVIDGKADCFISRPGQLKKYSDDERVHSVLLTKAAGSAFAVRRDNTVLLSILNNVLDMARIESGKAELDENYGRIDEMLEELCNVFAIEAEKKQLQLVHELQVEHEHILCDATKVKEVFSNLISNAIKYTPAGGKITLRVQELPCDREGYVRIQTEVKDTGIGMSKEYLPMLFDTFSRERNTTIGKVAGTGLGMSIVKKLVDMMGGTIEVASELGKGSCFTVTLQHKLADEAYYKQPEKVAAPEVKRELLQGKRILLAEDNDLNAEIATIILGRLGLEIVRVADGVQCVERITQHEAGTYDAILMDIQMPNMDGYKATQTIRNLADKKKAAIPIIAMTANAFEEDRQAAYKAGMDGHIAKPIDVDKVGKILSSLLNK